MSSNNKIVLTFQDGTIEANITKGNESIVKNVSYADLGGILSERTEQESPWLPGEYGLQKYSYVGNMEYYLYLEPAKMINLNYNDGSVRKQYKTIIPITAYFIALRKSGLTYKHVGSKIAALKSPIFSGAEVLYEVPVGNIYDDQRICWGRNDIQVPQLKSIQGLSNLFCTSEFNSDLDGNKFSSFRNSENSELNRCIHLYNEMDKRIEQGMTFEEGNAFIQSIMRKIHGDSFTISRMWKDFIANN